MDEKSILEILDSEAKEVQDIKKNLDITKKFLDLVKEINSLPEMDRRSHKECRSLYEAVSNGRDSDTMGKQLEGFFGPPSKRAEEPVPLKLRVNSSVRYLGGIRKDQALFIRKLKLGEFYAALWPWQSTPETMTVHLGYCCNKMSDEDYAKLEKLIDQALGEQEG